MFRRRHFIIYLISRRSRLIWARFLHGKWSCSWRTLGDDMLTTRCPMLNSSLIDRYFSVHLMINIGDVKLSTNVVYGRNGLCSWTVYICGWTTSLQLKLLHKRIGLNTEVRFSFFSIFIKYGSRVQGYFQDSCSTRQTWDNRSHRFWEGKYPWCWEQEVSEVYSELGWELYEGWKIWSICSTLRRNGYPRSKDRWDQGGKLRLVTLDALQRTGNVVSFA